MASLLLCCALILASLSTGGVKEARAGLPIAVASNGAEVSWRSAITYTPDQGTLGSLSNAEAVALVQELFQTWQNVPTASLSIQQSGQLPVDVTAGNYAAYYNTDSNVHPVIFDTDGSITDALFGSNARLFTLGFAGPNSFLASDGEVLDAQAVLNGIFLDGVDNGSNPEVSLDTFKTTFIHEFGHFLGLGHSQANIGTALDREAIFSNNPTVPIMFPFAIGNQPPTLTLDDKAQITHLYPNAGMASTYGAIRGRVLMPDGQTPFQGASVIARRIDDPLNIVVSSVSGYRYRVPGTNRGSTDSSLQGLFEITGLPPGNYTVEVEPIYPEFIGGSGLGPLDPPLALPGPAEYYSGANESNSDSSGSAAIVSVGGGQTIDNTDIILNSSLIPSVNESGTHSSMAQAQAISVPSVISGSVASTDPGSAVGALGTQVQDFYTFTASANDWVTIELNWPSSSANLDLYLYRANGDRISSSYICTFGSSCGSGYNPPPREQIGPLLLTAAGTYYIGVSANASAASYTLQVTSQHPNIQSNNVSVTTVNAASYQSSVAADSIVSAFGTQLATGSAGATSLPLPTSLGGTTVTVNGTPAGLLFVSPMQINYVLPAGIPDGTANVVVTNGGIVSQGTLSVSTVAPSLFTANSDGLGAPAAVLFRLKSNNDQSYEVVVQFDSGQGRYVPTPIVRAAGDRLFLFLYGTGFRSAPNSDGNSGNGVAESVQATVGGVAADVLYAGPAPGFIGLDQINIEIPASVAAGSSISLLLRVSNGQSLVQANAVTIAIE
jgi:uncharacterized protein (TIGR03437 family)